MLSFIARRFAATLVVLLVASFIVYQLTAISGDPLAEIRASRDPNTQDRLRYLTGMLDLDVPPFLRYFYWLGGAAGCLVGRCDLGVSIAKGESLVTDALAGAIASTLQLIILATVLSILVGVAVGMTTALRQYSGPAHFLGGSFAKGVRRNQIQSLFSGSYFWPLGTNSDPAFACADNYRHSWRKAQDSYPCFSYVPSLIGHPFG